VKAKGLILVVILAVGIAILSIGLSRNGEEKKKMVAVGLPAPDFAVAASADGAVLNSSQLKGRVVFVNFWASWCQPCKDEMPSVQALYEATRSDDRIVIVTVLYKDSPRDALQYMRSKGFTFPVYIDPKKSYRAFGVTGVPETYIIDKQGTLRRRAIGPADWTSPEERTLITSLVNG
jgi:cytochrome c biogenesis protein CcmG/thiol:disulfide interchange protein DsbE